MVGSDLSKHRAQPPCYRAQHQGGPPGDDPLAGPLRRGVHVRSAPWVVGDSQLAIVALEHDGWIRGKVLDAGCGTGEHTIHLTRLGYDVRGIDFSANAIDQARANAAQRHVAAQFEVADALRLGTDPSYDTALRDIPAGTQPPDPIPTTPEAPSIS